MSGPAGSGKSTWAENMRIKQWDAGDRPFRIISSDVIRFEKFGAYKIPQEQEKQVIPAMLNEIRWAKSGRFNVIVDVAICKNKSRIKWFNRLKSCGYDDIELVIVEVPLETALRQNASRDRKVPEEVIKDMYRMLEEPTQAMYDMFSKITKVTR